MMAWMLLLVAAAVAEYTEHLNVTPLSRKEVLSEFTFEISQPLDDLSGDIRQFTSFPLSLGQILELSNTTELHLRFGQGMWDEASWGAVPRSGTSSGGVGVELWAFVNGDKEEDVTRNWRRLTNALSGYFCASINFINEAATVWPSSDIAPSWGQVPPTAELLRGALPAEPICTENLTPFLKLLPCRGKAGIASLLDGHTLFASRWQSMGVDVWRSDDVIHLQQRILVVHDTNKAVKDLPYALPADELLCDKSKSWANDWTCLPLTDPKAHFDFSEIFGAKINGICPQVDNGVTNVDVNIPAQLRNSDPFTVNGQVGSDHFTFQIERNDTFNLDISCPNTVVSEITENSPPLIVDRSFGGLGQQSGAIRTVFENKRPHAIRVKYLETLPWFMRLYLHTTKVNGHGRIESRVYSPAVDRERPSMLELEITIEPNELFEVEYSFDRSLLFLEEYPPDANHGFEIPPGLAVVVSENEPRYEVRTTSPLLSLPVPDFSMPYNVIILTSTVMALAFGTIYNLADRAVCPEDKLPPRKNLKDRLVEKLRQRFARFTR